MLEHITHEQAHTIKTAVTELMPDVTVLIVSGLTATVERASPTDGSRP